MPTMAYIVGPKRGSWEIRESRMTDRGPRSRTLATFAVLDEEVISRARSRSAGGLDRAELLRNARRAGAPVAQPPADEAARVLLSELSAGRRPARALRRLLADALAKEPKPSSAARSAAAWVEAGPAERGEALRDLLLFADRIPAAARRRGQLKFPPLASR